MILSYSNRRGKYSHKNILGHEIIFDKNIDNKNIN